MSRRTKRILIPLVVSLAMLGVVLTMVFSNRRGNTPTPTTPTTTTQAVTQAVTQPAAAIAATASVTQPDASTTTAPSATTAPQLTAITQGLRTAPVESSGSPVASLGSLDPRTHQMQLNLTRAGAGIGSILFSNQWTNAPAKRIAEQYLKSVGDGQSVDFSKLDETHRYVLKTPHKFTWAGGSIDIPMMAAHSVTINGQEVSLLKESSWSETAPGVFETMIINGDDQPVAKLTRRFELGNGYDITLRQRVTNLTSAPLEIRWRQYGPTDLGAEGTIDRRRLDFGYQQDPIGNPDIVLSKDSGVEFERSSALKLYKNSLDNSLTPQQRKELLSLWPNRASTKSGYGLSWFASISRYFSIGVHPLVDPQNKASYSLANVIEEVRLDASGVGTPSETLFTFLVSPLHTIQPGAELSLDLAVYAGPLDRHVLNEPPYSLLAMNQMILYQMSSCCSFLTFQWLAHGLLWFLSFLHDYIVFDWGIAIIVLVIVVRSLLHPLTKKSQINMQRFGKQMSSMKPEIDKIQKKYKDEPKKAQAEQMRLMKEHGVNPLQMLGCLPMFLQMPIWIALWAMLYLAFDIRHEPAFYGFFQMFGGWKFMGDLSAQDNFISLGAGFTIPLLGVQITAINLLPLLMGVVFYFQQKYMSPPPTPNMTPEQIQQQKIMKVMMVVMFPLMLYTTPSGLTLYITTSTIIGIFESKYVRKHITDLELNPPKPKDPTKKPKDLKSRLMAKAIERAQAKRNEAEQLKFKKRK